MRADYEFDFQSNTKSRAGCEKIVYIKLPKYGFKDQYVVLELGTLTRISFNTTTAQKPVYSLTRKSANMKCSGPGSCYGVLVFQVINTSTIEYLKNQIREITGSKYIDAFRLQDLPDFDIILISADENDTSGNYSKRIIRGVTIDSESGALGSDVLAISEEYTFKAVKIGELTAKELQIYSPSIKESMDKVNGGGANE